MTNAIDHFSIGAATLEQGTSALQRRLGVVIPGGSKHTAMSTHNCVTKAGDGLFLELIAVDPEAPDPGRVRWFTLDDAATQARLAATPRALCWVVRTSNLDAIVADSPVDLGDVVHFSRGDRTWRLTVPADGSLPEAGLLPAFIEWSPGPHPSEGMQDLGVELDRIVLHHPDPNGLHDKLKALQVDHLAEVVMATAPALSFVLKTPSGEVVEVN